MASCYEFEGKTTEDAVQNAADALNIPKGKLKYTVISHGSTGIFGLVGVKKAKISVTAPKEASTEGRDNRNRKKPSSGKKRKGNKENTYDTLEQDTSEESVASLVREAFDLNDKDNDGDTAKTSRSDASGASDRQPRQAAAPRDFKTAIDTGCDALQRIIDFITSGATIAVEEMEDRVMFNISGGNAGVLIGKRGQTLEAIQYIVEKIVNKNNSDRIRIQVDVEGYLDNRRTSLEGLAHKLAERTRTTGRPSTMGQMNAHDRRIVHLTLKDDTSVRTQSIGDGFYRKLVIFPKKNIRRRRNAK